MDIREQDFALYLSSISDDFAREAQSEILGKIKYRGYEVTGSLARSIKISVNKDAKNYSIGVTLDFLEKGKGLDSKKNIASRMSVEQAVQWVKDKGLQNFEFIPGYDGTLPTIDVAARRLAYMFINNKSTVRKNYQGPIIYRPFFGVWAEYREDMIKEFVEFASEKTLKDLASAFKQVKGKYYKAK